MRTLTQIYIYIMKVNIDVFLISVQFLIGFFIKYQWQIPYIVNDTKNNKQTSSKF